METFARITCSMGNVDFFVSFKEKQSLLSHFCLEFTKWEVLHSHTDLPSYFIYIKDSFAKQK